MSLTNEQIGEYYDLYDVKIKILDDKRVEIYQYSEHIKLLKEGYENPLKKRIKYDKAEKGTSTIRDDSLNRSFSRLMDLSICNADCFKTFITLTFAENVTDLDYANKKFNEWTSNVRKVFPDFKYLGVPEFQKRGAVHYHLMSNLDTNTELIPLQKNTNNTDNIDMMFDVKYWSHGFASVFDLKLTDDNFSVALYLAKYFYKDIDNRLFGRRKILKSRNLDDPKIIKLDSNEIDKINKYIENKKIVEKKSIIPTTEYAPKVIVKTSYI